MLGKQHNIGDGHSGNFELIYDYLDKLQIPYEVLEHLPTRTLEQTADECHINRSELIRTVILSEPQGELMAILPQDRLLDFSVLCKTLNRELNPANPDIIKSIFKQCEPGSYPPLPDFFELDAIIDKSVLSLKNIYFEPGNHRTLIKMQLADFLQLLQNAWQGEFSAPISSLTEKKSSKEELNAQISQFTPRRFESRLHENFDLPAMPQMADQLLKLRSNADATVGELAKIIELDPSLSAQLLKWSQSPFYGFKGKIDSVECAIVRVLGFDLVLNLALGLALNRSMKVPMDGPLGLKAYWKFSIYTAALVDQIILQMPIEKRPLRGLAYLAGLLHNFGHLVLAELFPPQHYLLNRYLAVNPDVCMTEIEQHVLGVTHTHIGAWLLQNWGLPKEIIAAVKWHHQEEYVDKDAIYSNLVFTATRILKGFQLGDANNSYIPEALYEILSLTEQDIDKAVEKFMSKKDSLDAVVDQLS